MNMTARAIKSGRATPTATPANAPAVNPSESPLAHAVVEGVAVARAVPTSAAIWFGRSTIVASSDKEKVLVPVWQAVVFTPQTNSLLPLSLVHGVIATEVDESTVQH
jgi:hypothetical protein